VLHRAAGDLSVQAVSLSGVQTRPASGGRRIRPR
jgi:hypothetical protein